jgi:hypothetical protein
MIVKVVHTSPFTIVVTVDSSDGTKTYDINILYLKNEKKWVATWCSCMGFQTWTKCKHVQSIKDYMETLPHPHTDGILLKQEGYWYRCGFCNNITFLFCPPLNKRAATQAVCSKCGRGYEVI